MPPEFASSAAILLEGLALGAFILCLGFLMGHWFGPKRHAAVADKHLDEQRLAKLLRDLHQFTGSFSHEMAEYRSTLGTLRDQYSATGDNSLAALGGTPEMVSNMLDANERLQRRLNTAEATLRQQAEEITGYLSEARSDALTGLPNRRAFDEECSRRLAEWRRHGSPFSVVLIDVDHFKAFNDRYGHLVGDKVLRDVANVLRRSRRETDFVARFGGEEFALVLPAIHLGDASSAGERMRSAIAHAQFAHGDGDALQVTVSCGVAQALQNEELAALLERADQALYASKRAGRNNAHWHDGLRCVPVKRDPNNAGEGVSANLQEACLDLRKRLLEVAAEEKEESSV